MCGTTRLTDYLCYIAIREGKVGLTLGIPNDSLICIVS